jgi:hypothetical protein
MTDLPPPPPMTPEPNQGESPGHPLREPGPVTPLSIDEIVGHLRDHWIQNIGADWGEANQRAERGFWHMLQTGSLREWGFDNQGETLYECHSPVAQTIVYVLVQKEE